MTPKSRDFGIQLLAAIPILSLDTNCIKQAVEIHAQLHTSNQLIPLADILIAATAVANGLTLLTLNQKHFTRIKNLRLHSLDE